MGDNIDRKKLEEIVAKIRELGMTYVDGANEFGIPVRRIYEFNRQRNRKKKVESASVTENKVAVQVENEPAVTG